MNKTKKEKALDNKCPSCKAPIFFSPSLGKWKCDYCGSEFTLEEIEAKTNAGAKANNEPVKTKSDEKETEVTKTETIEEDNTNYITYRCENCGAEIITDEETAATFCLYCGNTAILKNKLSGKFAPNYVIPFKIEKEKAIEAFKNLSQGRPFVPKDFNNENNIEKIKGLYVPFWLFDVSVDGSIDCDATKVSNWTSGDRAYTKKEIYKLYRTGSMKFNNIPADGSTRFDDKIMNSIEPFNFKDLVPYNHAYLSGFFAEKYDTEADAVAEIATDRAKETAKDTMYNDSHYYTTKVITNNTLEPTVIEHKYVLLPVWMVNVKYKDKYYIFAMNGQTGEFIGDIPLDKKKVILWTILMFVGIFVLIIIISLILHFLGGNA